MLGIIIGTFATLAIVKAVHRRRLWYAGYAPMHFRHAGPPWARYRGHGYHHGWGPDGEDGWERTDPWTRRGGRGGPARYLARRLDATPEQARVIEDAFDELRDEVKAARGEMKETRGDLSRAMGADHFDEEILGDLFARHDDHLRHLRATFVGTLAKIHDVLDEEQRKRLAKLIGRGRGGFGPYRGMA